VGGWVDGGRSLAVALHRKADAAAESACTNSHYHIHLDLSLTAGHRCLAVLVDGWMNGFTHVVKR